MNIAKFFKRSKKNRFIISIILFIMIPIFIIFQSKFLKSLKNSIRNNSSEQIIDNNTNKVAIKFRLTNIYRIGIHKFTETFKIFG